MDDTTRASRTSYYKSLNFAGTVDWAVDLLAFTEDDGVPSDGQDFDDDSWELGDSDVVISCNAVFDSMEALDAVTDIPDFCKSIYTLETLSATLSGAVKNYSDMM